MGSCISTKKPSKRSQQPPPIIPPKHQNLQDRALVPESDPPIEPEQLPITSKTLPYIPLQPILPAFEEETVKEVLSETPTVPKPSYLKYPSDQQKILRLPSFPKLVEEKRAHAPPPFEAVFEVSEIESVSTSREFEEVGHQQLQQRMIDRSPSKIHRRTDSGEYYARVESPVRRSEQWLCRRNDIAGGAGAGKLEVGLVSRQRSLMQNGGMKDQGESSRRRSRSPAATRTGAMCRSPSGKRIVRSSGMITASSPDIGRTFEGSSREDKLRGKESLEDPLVSLECFIFL